MRMAFRSYSWLLSGILLLCAFFKDGELTGRAMKKVPHPFVVETMERFAQEPLKENGQISTTAHHPYDFSPPE